MRPLLGFDRAAQLRHCRVGNYNIRASKSYRKAGNVKLIVNPISSGASSANRLGFELCRKSRSVDDNRDLFPSALENIFSEFHEFWLCYSLCQEILTDVITHVILWPQFFSAKQTLYLTVNVRSVFNHYEISWRHCQRVLTVRSNLVEVSTLFHFAFGRLDFGCYFVRNTIIINHLPMNYLKSARERIGFC